MVRYSQKVHWQCHNYIVIYIYDKVIYDIYINLLSTNQDGSDHFHPSEIINDLEFVLVSSSTEAVSGE